MQPKEIVHYRLRDNCGIEEDITAATIAEAREKAHEWVAGGDWDTESESVFVGVQITETNEAGEELEDGEGEHITVVIDPPEPSCVSGKEHRWEDDIDIVGGIESAPGVWSNNNGGVWLTECCANCGTYRKQDTRAQNPENGESGFHTTWYEDADEDSLAWVDSLGDETEAE